MTRATAGPAADKQTTRVYWAERAPRPFTSMPTPRAATRTLWGRSLSSTLRYVVPSVLAKFT